MDPEGAPGTAVAMKPREKTEQYVNSEDVITRCTSAFEEMCINLMREMIKKLH